MSTRVRMRVQGRFAASACFHLGAELDRIMTPETDPVAPGTLVELRLINQSGEVEPISFCIVADKLADYRNGFLGEGTPLARAILGHKAGSRITYGVDDIAAIEIVSVKRPFSPLF